MKKIFLIFLFFFCSQSTAIVSEYNFFDDKETLVKFVYINGSNNDTPKMREWFYSGIDELHPCLKNSFENSAFVQEKLLKNNSLKISKHPEIFFWGDKTVKELDSIKERLLTTSMVSPKMAQSIRTLFAYCMHDAIWVQKEHNMETLLDDLHSQIKSITKNGDKVVLYGYSAGSFITYEYLFNKLPGLTKEELIKRLKLSSEEQDFVEKNNAKPTCISAITKSNLGILTASGRLIANQNYSEFQKAYRNIDKYTAEYCIPDNTVLGVVNYASPLSLFYSDIVESSIEINQYNVPMFKNIQNKDLFLLFVNWADDPLSFPLTKNSSKYELQKQNKIKFDDNGNGFFYDKSDVKSPATFLGAHTSYFKYSKKFSKAVVDAYIEGYLNFYSLNK